MFNGHRATEHEEKVVYSGVRDLEKMILLLIFFFSKAIACFFPPAIISSLCSKYASSKE